MFVVLNLKDGVYDKTSFDYVDEIKSFADMYIYDFKDFKY